MPKLTQIAACVVFAAVAFGATGTSFGDSVTFGLLVPANAVSEFSYTPGNGPTNGLTTVAGSSNTLFTITDSGTLSGLTFTDVVMTFTGLQASGAASVTMGPGSGEMVVQDLTDGTFSISTTASGKENGVTIGSQVLLSGTVSDSYLELDGKAGKSPLIGSFNVGTVSYTGGSLAGLFGANQLVNSGDFGFILGGFNGTLGTSTIGGVKELNGFTANASGILDADVAPQSAENPNFGPTSVPLPAAAWMGLSTLGGLGIMGIFRKRSATS